MAYFDSSLDISVGEAEKDAEKIRGQLPWPQVLNGKTDQITCLSHLLIF